MEPLTVWKVELVSEQVHHDDPGSLVLGEDALVFAGADGDERRIAYAGIVRAKRLRLSPVLVVTWDDAGTARRTAFYLTKPPPLRASVREAPPPSMTDRLSRRAPTKRSERRRNSYYLTSAGVEVQPTLKAWAAALRERVVAARG